MVPPYIIGDHRTLAAQHYQPVAGWSDTANQRIEAFLNSTKIIHERKVAVFDCDGTFFGQVPYYLADEAIYAYAQSHYADKKDTLSRRKIAIVGKVAFRGGKQSRGYGNQPTLASKAMVYHYSRTSPTMRP